MGINLKPFNAIFKEEGQNLRINPYIIKQLIKYLTTGGQRHRVWIFLLFIGMSLFNEEVTENIFYGIFNLLSTLFNKLIIFLLNDI